MDVRRFQRKVPALFLILTVLAPALGATQPQFLEARAVPRGQVALYRDDWGMPHVYASTEEDGYFGLGYATAEDRLVQILFLYLRVRGELAKEFGAEPIRNLAGVRAPPGTRTYIEDPLASDREVLRARYLVDARANYARLSEQLQLNMKRFIAGIERYMTLHPDAVPSWAPKLEPALPLAIYAEMLFPTNAQPCTSKLRNAPPIAAYGSAAPSLMGSNAWALAGSRTADGGTILGSDSHGDIFGLAGPTFYMWRLSTPTLDVLSVEVPGTASMLLGHSRYFGWAWTEGPRLTADCYAIETLESNPRDYKYDQRELAMEVVPYRIEVRGSDPVSGEFEYTQHNGVRSPVVRRQGRTAYVVSSAYMGRSGFLTEQMYALATARDRRALRATLDRRDWYPANLIVAGADGTLLYTRPGRIPKRAPGVDPKIILDGNTSRTAWRDLHTFEEAVQIWSPSQGFVANTNASPDMMYPEPVLRPEAFPGYFMFEPGRTNPRQRRLIDLLGRAARFSDADAEATTFDVQMPDTERWGPAIAAAFAAEGTTDARKAAFIRALTQFNGRFEASSAGALFHVWLRRQLFLRDAKTFDALSIAVDGGRPLNDELQRVLVQGVNATFTALQRDARCDYLNKNFGDVYRIGRGARHYPSSGVNFPIRKQTPRAGAPLLAVNYEPREGSCQQWAFSGPHAAYTVHFGTQVKSFSVFLWGASEDPDSPHFNDQSPLASARHLRPNWFEPQELAAHLATSQLIATHTDRRREP